MHRTALLLACLVVLGGCTGNTRPGGGAGEVCQPINDDQVKELFTRWNKSLKGTPDDVIANYTDDAVLLPTVSDKPHVGRPKIREYFVEFLKKEPQGTIDDKQRWIHRGCNIAEDVGLYTFQTNKGKVDARYTFVYHHVGGGKWLIWNHHSSMLPERYCDANKPGIPK